MRRFFIMFSNNDDRNNFYTPPPAVIHHQSSPLVEGVVVPGIQAAITGVLTGAAAGAVSAWFAAPAWAIAGTVMLVAMLGAWLSYRGRWAWMLERLTGADLNGDRFIGEPVQQVPELPSPEPLRIDLTQLEDGSRTRDIIDLPPTITREKVAIFARGLLGGRVFSQTTWTGGAGLFSRSEYSQLVDVFISRGLATWKNPNAHAQGVEVTAPGRAVLRRLAGTPTPPEDR